MDYLEKECPPGTRVTAMYTERGPCPNCSKWLSTLRQQHGAFPVYSTVEYSKRIDPELSKTGAAKMHEVMMERILLWVPENELPSPQRQTAPEPKHAVAEPEWPRSVAPVGTERLRGLSK